MDRVVAVTVGRVRVRGRWPWPWPRFPVTTGAFPKARRAVPRSRRLRPESRCQRPESVAVGRVRGQSRTRLCVGGGGGVEISFYRLKITFGFQLLTRIRRFGL